MSNRRTFTESERAAILQEADEHGLSVTIRKHKLTASLIYKWRNRTSSDASLASIDVPFPHGSWRPAHCQPNRGKFNLLQWSIRKEDVVELFDGIFARYPLPSQVTVRSDNGSQFESGPVRGYFAARGIAQEFTRPATPEQNAYIEGYHSVVQRAVYDAKAFDDLDDAQTTFDRFRTFYNYERLHSGIGY